MKRVIYMSAVLLLAACSSAAPRRTTPVHWIEATRTLTQLSANHNGLFSEYNPTIDADPYATYYALRTLTLLNAPIPHQATTQRWLLDELTRDLEQFETSINALGDIYYVLQALKLLDVDLQGLDAQTQATIRERVESLFMDAGYFVGSLDERQLEPNFSFAITTYQAVTVLDLLGYRPTYADAVITWLNTLWEQAYAQNPPDVPLLAQVYRTLNLLVDDIAGYAEGAIFNRAQADPAQPLIYAQNLVALAQATQHPVQIDTSVLEAIVASQNRDGGFGPLPDTPSDMLGCTLAVEVLQYAGKLDAIDIAALRNLILSREFESGGFANIVAQEPNYAVTYYIYRYESIFAAGVQNTTVALPRTFESTYSAYHATLLAKLLDLPAVSLPRLDVQAGLGTIYFYLLQAEALDQPVEPAIKAEIRRFMAQHYALDALFNNQQDLRVDTAALVLTVYAILDQHSVSTRQLHQLDQLIQTRLKPNMLGLDELHRALLLMQRYDYQPTAPAMLRQWILDCFTPQGGVAPQPIAYSTSTPSLYLTGLALESLGWLGADPTAAHIRTMLQQEP